MAFKTPTGGLGGGACDGIDMSHFATRLGVGFAVKVSGGVGFGYLCEAIHIVPD